MSRERRPFGSVDSSTVHKCGTWQAVGHAPWYSEWKLHIWDLSFATHNWLASINFLSTRILLGVLKSRLVDAMRRAVPRRKIQQFLQCNQNVRPEFDWGLLPRGLTCPSILVPGFPFLYGGSAFAYEHCAFNVTDIHGRNPQTEDGSWRRRSRGQASKN